MQAGAPPIPARVEINQKSSNPDFKQASPL